MRRCSLCKIDYSGDLDLCPLCGSTLTGTPTASPFPKIKFKQASKLAQKILALVSLLLFAAIVIICIVLKAQIAVTICALIAFVVNYIFVRNIIVHSPDFLRMIERYFLVIMAMGLLAFIGTGNSAISMFIIPAISITAIVFDGVVLTIFRRKFVSDYAKYLLSDLVLSLVPAVLTLCGAPTIPHISIICVMAGLLMIVFLVVGAKTQVSDEAKRLFDT